MEYFKSRKVKLLLAMLSLLFLMNMVQDSYAKYISSASANSNFTIAEWTFKVNDQDVLQTSDFSDTIVPVLDSNNNIKEGYIAPGSTGYFDVNIDYTNVGVSFSEELKLSYPSSNSVSDLVITGYSLNNGSVTALSSSNSILLNHYLSETTRVDNIRVFVKWVDGSTEKMNNTQDTEAAKNGQASVKVDLHLIQLAE